MNQYDLAKELYRLALILLMDPMLPFITKVKANGCIERIQRFYPDIEADIKAEDEKQT
jgi:hypothetical protein